MSTTNRLANDLRREGRVVRSVARPRAHPAPVRSRGEPSCPAYRRPVAQTSAANAAWASAVARSRSSVRPNQVTSWAPSRPPTTAPAGKPAMILGKLALIPAMSSSRPACPPMNTKPSWIRIGNRTSSGTDTHAPPALATSHETPIATAAAPSTTSAMPRRSKRWAVRAIAPETAIPAAPIAM